MSAGDKIPCDCLTDAFVKMDDLIRQGYEVQLEHNRRKTLITIMEVPDARADEHIRLDAVSTART